MTAPAFISVNRLRNRKGPFPVGDWIMDSGAFTEISTHGRWRESPETYAAEIKRWSRNGNLLRAAAQDLMCEEWILAKASEVAGRTVTVEDHQRETIARYDALIACDTGGIPILPCLQGFTPESYVSHVRQYGARLTPGMWVGVGSVCKRNASPSSIVAVLRAIKGERPDLRLHGFGLKKTALQLADVRDLLYSADSMAWSFAARMGGRNGNDWREAESFANRIGSMPVQMGFL